jgi:hypothetical protein
MSATTKGATPPWNAGWSKISFKYGTRDRVPARRRVMGPAGVAGFDAW